MINYIKDISSIVLAFIIGAIQLLPVNFDKEKPFYQLGVVKWIMDNSIFIIGICCLIIIAINIIGSIIDKRVGKKKWLSSVLQEIVDKYLCGKNCHTRITIFTPTRNKKKLKCYVRFGYPLNFCPDPRRIPIASTDDSYIGVVGKCLFEVDEVECHTKSIKNIKLAKTFDKNIPENREHIKKYMEDTYLPDYKILQRMHRKSTNFYAYPITDKNANIWGVLIIDNNEDKEFDFTQVKTVIKSYTDIISLTLKL